MDMWYVCVFGDYDAYVIALSHWQADDHVEAGDIYHDMYTTGQWWLIDVNDK